MSIPSLSFEGSNGPLRADLIAAFEAFLDSQWYILGKSVAHFEEAYTHFNSVQHCVGVSNGLDALCLALEILGVGPSDEVIVPSNAYIASVLAVSQVGATPVFVEPDIATANIDPTKIAVVIGPRTKAIMPVHLYGQACEMGAIMALAEKHSLWVVEDNAQAQGAAYNNQLTGSFGHLNATSFYPTKNLGALGDAGALTTNREAYAERAKILRNYGSATKYHHPYIGYNRRLDECQAAFLSVKLPHLNAWNAERQRIANWYNHHLSEVEELHLPVVAEGATHIYHLYVVRCAQRDALQTFLGDKGIGTLIHYPVPPHLQPAYAHLGYKRGDFPIAELWADTCLSLPMYPGLSEAQVVTVAEAIKSFFA